jgi:hypothetical protein
MLEIAAQDTFQPANLNADGLARYKETLARHIAEGDVTSFHHEVAAFPGHYLQGDKRGIIPVDWAERLAVTDWLACGTAPERVNCLNKARRMQSSSAPEPRMCLAARATGLKGSVFRSNLSQPAFAQNTTTRPIGMPSPYQ